MISPYFLEPNAAGHSSYVIGHDSCSSEVRAFKLERIQQLELTDERFSVPRASAFKTGEAVRPTLRSQKSQQVTASLHFSRTPVPNQHAIWAEVEVRQRSTGTHSPTAALRDSFLQRALDLDRIVATLNCPSDGPTGVVGFLDGRASCADLSIGQRHSSSTGRTWCARTPWRRSITRPTSRGWTPPRACCADQQALRSPRSPQPGKAWTFASTGRGWSARRWSMAARCCTRRCSASTGTAAAPAFGPHARERSDTRVLVCSTRLLTHDGQFPLPLLVVAVAVATPLLVLIVVVEVRLWGGYFESLFPEQINVPSSGWCPQVR